MTTKTRKRFILVSRKTRLQELIERFNTWPQAKFYLEHNQVDARDYLLEHDHYQQQLLQAETVLKRLGRFQALEREFLSTYQFAPEDIIVVIGQDGLVANTLKYLQGQPVVAINPDPKRWEGKLLPFELPQLDEIVARVLTGGAASEAISFAEARTNDGQVIRGVNDLFIGPRSHTSARYELRYQGRTEEQSSSGIIISTGFGSSGWLKSILAGAKGVAGISAHPLENGFGWSERKLQFTVREPFPSRFSSADIVFGAINNGEILELESHMPENGVVFSDGIEKDYLNFNSGSVVKVSVAEVQGQLIVE